MSKYCLEYKKKTAGFGIIEDRRFLRGLEEAESRKLRRLSTYANNRRIVDRTKTQQGQPDAQPSRTDDRRAKLLKWKAEREQQKQLKKQTKQPVFRTGIPHHKYNSPIFLHQSLPIVKPTNPSSAVPRITRATAKRIAARKADNEKGGPVPVALNKTQTLKNSKTPKKAKDMETSFAPENHKFKAPEGLPALQFFGPKALNGTKGESAVLPIYFSPCVIASRGNGAGQKERLRTMKDDETFVKTSMEEFDQRIEAAEKSPCLPEAKELTLPCFKLTTAKEVNRLKNLCQHWEAVKNDDNVPEDAQLIINQAIGQTNLLINKKIEQFKKLIVDCETGSGEKLVTCQDLQGFWDMVYMQVEDCNSRFCQLKMLQDKNWVEEQPEVSKKVPASKKPVATKKIVPARSSSVRDMIRAARKKQLESNRPANLSAVIVGKSGGATTSDSSQLSAVKFDGGFFMVESPRKTVTPRSTRKSTLFQQPKHSEEAERRRSALTLMKVSRVLKPVEIRSDSVTPGINPQQTPGNSILKQRDTCQSTSWTNGSQNQIKCTENQERLITNNSQLGELSFIIPEDEGLNTELQSHGNVNRKLRFLPDMNSSDSDSGSDQHTNSADTKDEKPLACPPRMKDSVSTKRISRRTHKGVLVEHNDKTDSESSNTEKKEPATPNTKQNLTIKESHKENETPSKSDSTTQRRSTRKSVRFTGAECTACAETRTVYPMTPRTNRKSRLSTGSAKKGTPLPKLENDLISFDTPKDLPPRVRRSSRLQNTKP